MNGVEIHWERDGTGTDSFVRIDGKDVGHVTSINIDLSVGDIPQVAIKCITPDLYLKIDDADASIEPVAVVVARKDQP